MPSPLAMPVVPSLLDSTSIDSGWSVDSFEIEEAANRPYRCRIQVTGEDVDADPMKLFGADLRLCLARGQRRRFFPGLVSQLELRPGGEGRRAAEFVMEPALAVLGRNRDTRIFQGLGVLDVVKQVLEAGLAPFRRRVRVAAERPGVPREYCVQYQESDLAFVLRLLSQEGFGLFFEEDDESSAERVVISDRNEQFRKARPQPVRFEMRRNDHSPDGRFRDFVICHEAQPRRFTVSDHDWTRPSAPSSVTTPDGDSDTDRDVREHDIACPWRRYDEGQGRYAASELDSQAQLRSQRAEVERCFAMGNGDCIELAPGTTFDLSNHPVAGANRSYVVVEATHQAKR